MINMPRKTVGQLFKEGTAIDAALRRAVQDALRRHKLLGNTVIVWQDGKVIRLQPEEIPASDTASQS